MPRRATAALTNNTRPVAWADGWHQVKVVREAACGRLGLGSFDDMNDFDDIRLYAKP
jgi:hypothetical protein